MQKFLKIINAVFGFITRNAKRLAFFLLAAVFVLGCALVAYDTSFDFIRDDPYDTYDKNGEKVTVEIPEGSTVEEIGNILKENGLINNVMAFRLKAKLTGGQDDFQYGVYTFVKGMSDSDIMETLKDGNKEQSVSITIPEGWSVRQIGAYLEEKGICLQSEFEDACNRTDYDFDFYDQITNADKREFLLEGYLFPDTYDVIPEKGAEGVVQRMLREFERKWEQHAAWKEELDQSGRTMDQVITMASAIEKEAALDNERPKVARVLLNRMDQGLNWGLNCTVLYALGKEGTGDDFVSYDDLETDSPYNTYKYLGYPVGPICSPSEASIQAALEPADGDWLYFIGYEDGSNEHLFTSDYSEFEAVQNGTYVKPEDDSSQLESEPADGDGTTNDTDGNGN